jgi:hypothetical protein
MLKQCIVLSVVALAWGGSIDAAAAQHQRYYEFDGTHVALSIERFMGIDYTDFEGPGNADAYARLFLNANEPVPTSLARFGVDVFIRRFSIGLAGGVATAPAPNGEIGIIAPRVGYLLGLTPTIGLWLRVGGFYAATPGANYAGLTAEALFAWFPYDIFAFHFGPTLDLAFADDPNPDYVSIGIPEIGMSVFF